jgi:hypothetical protein
MKNLLNDNDRAEVTARVRALTADHKALWGQMDVAQMVTHCQRPIELALMNPKPARSLMGYLMGRLAKNDVFGPKPFKKGSFTPPQFKIVDPQDFHTNKEKLLQLIERFPKEMPNVGQVHPFFGPLTLTEWGQGQYKHLDHHLSQFGA